MVVVYVALAREAETESLIPRVHALLLPDTKTGTWGEIAVKRSAIAGFGECSTSRPEPPASPSVSIGSNHDNERTNSRISRCGRRVP